MLFGGQSLLAPVDDTWAWNGTRWTFRAPAHRPRARYSHMLAFDAVRQRTVLFGGGDDIENWNDTWEWDGSDWLARTPAAAPAVRYSSAFAYDIIRHAPADVHALCTQPTRKKKPGAPEPYSPQHSS